MGSAISAHLQRGRDERSRVSETGSDDNVAAWLCEHPLSAKSSRLDAAGPNGCNGPKAEIRALPGLTFNVGSKPTPQAVGS